MLKKASQFSVWPYACESSDHEITRLTNSPPPRAAKNVSRTEAVPLAEAGAAGVEGPNPK
jgi:hypothetical protein